MAIVTKAILKGYFETGDRPTEGQFVDLIDSLVTLTHANTGDVTIVGTLTVDNVNIGSHISASGIKASSGFSADGGTTSSFGYISSSGNIFTQNTLQATKVSASSFSNVYSLTHITSSGNISASGDVIGFTGSFHHLKGDGSGLTNVKVEDVVHGNKVSVTGSQRVTSNTNNTVATNNTGEFTIPIGTNYTVETGGQVDLQYTPIAERLYRYDVDTGTFKAYAQANIDSETTLIKGFAAGTAGVGNDVTVRHNATVPENFVTVLHTTTNVTQSEDPNNNPMTTDPHSITIQDQSTYTVKQGADVTVDGVHHGVVRKDIALFQTLGIGDTQAIGPSGSNSFNDQYNNLYPSASAHLHISASNPVVKIEAASGTGLLSIDGNISASGGTVTALSGSFSELSGNSPLTINGEMILTGNVTSSGTVISASGAIEAQSFAMAPLGMFIRDNSINGDGNNILLSHGAHILGNITASGNISSSGNITGITGSFEGWLVLTSPNGTKYRFTTNDSGHLSLTGSAV